MPRQSKKLTPRTIAALLKKPGKHADGDGLYLSVRPSGSASWLFRYMLNGKAREMGLGGYPDVSLSQARTATAAQRRLLGQRADPIDARRQSEAAKAAAAAKANVPTFAEAAAACIEAKRAGWRNAKHASQWQNTLSTYAFPIIGELRVDEIETEHVLKVLATVWTEKTETASRLRGRIETVLSFATAKRMRTGENPARWRGHLDQLLAAPAKVRAVEHHPALPWRELPDFMVRLRQQQVTTAQALELCILTATRSNEALGAMWSEIDLQARAWTIPAERMKGRRPHRIPLSDAALALLDRLPRFEGCDYLFPGRKPGRCLSDMSMLSLLRRMGRTDLTVHGFRSAFRDWCAEATNYPREIAEQALAHTITNKAEAAYWRGDVFDKRRLMMQQWAQWCLTTPKAGAVVPMASRTA